MIPTLDVESILRTWTPDSPCDIPLKGAQAASRQPSQPSQPTRPAFADAENREALRDVRLRTPNSFPLLDIRLNTDSSYNPHSSTDLPALGSSHDN
ncbi:hypothetical protein G5I_14011 [Acromyrmex echinatior]|uniref:Uncharacterized protein n=1 Tax=Acromyrmex echinatior TaxID=103372 RepID=F4X6P3_ACREC|nr:hypothetical protein G5I_14011 [Acromyrmex echinatior]